MAYSYDRAGRAESVRDNSSAIAATVPPGSQRPTK
jgi:hypothetical protein